MRKLSLLGALVIGITPATFGAMCDVSGSPESVAKQPNFIFIQGEGRGWSSASVAMDPSMPGAKQPDGLSPNLEKLAKGGMTFSEFYATSPRCTPSRASYVTGISPAKLHMTYVNSRGEEADGGDRKQREDRPGQRATQPREGGGGAGGTGKGGGGGRRGTEGQPASGDARPQMLRMMVPQTEMDLPPGVKTTADWLKPLGYASAHYGKWHVSRKDPKQNGFDDSDGPNTNAGPNRNVKPNPEEGISITDRGIAFMEAQIKAGKPFYLQIDHYGTGGEEEVTPEALEIARKIVPDARAKTLASAAGTVDMDMQIGRILDALDRLGIADHTYIMFSTDHGNPGGQGNRPTDGNAPLQRGKGSIYEGGVRVPFIVKGPGIKAGSHSKVRATGMDLVPTILDLAGQPIIVNAAKRDDRTSVEGGSLKAVLTGDGTSEVKRSRDEIVIHFPHYDLGNGGPATSIYSKNFKFIRIDETGDRFLFDMTTDPQEGRNLIMSEPELAKELEKKLDEYLDAIKAQRATPAKNGPAPGTQPSTAPAEETRKPRGEKPARNDRPASDREKEPK